MYSFKLFLFTEFNKSIVPIVVNINAILFCNNREYINHVSSYKSFTNVKKKKKT
jgi:hypothetical protein